MTKTNARFDQRVKEGVRTVLGGDVTLSERDQFARRELTLKGQRIFRGASESMSEEQVASIVTRALSAGYEE